MEVHGIKIIATYPLERAPSSMQFERLGQGLLLLNDISGPSKIALQYYDIENNKLSPLIHGYGMRKAVFLPNSDVIAYVPYLDSLEADSSVHFWSVGIGGKTAALEGDDEIWDFDVSPNGDRLAVAHKLSPHKSVVLWDLTKKRVLEQFGGFAFGAAQVRFLDQNKLFAQEFSNSELSVEGEYSWLKHIDVGTKKSTPLPGSSSASQWLMLEPRAKLGVGILERKIVSLSDLTTLIEFPLSLGPLRDCTDRIAMSFGGTGGGELGSDYQDVRVGFWDVKSGRQIVEIPDPQQIICLRPGADFVACLSADGKRFARYAHARGEIEIWDISGLGFISAESNEINSTFAFESS